MRDVLIALLVIGIALNVAVLFIAIMARPRPVASDGGDSSPGMPVPEPGPGAVVAAGSAPGHGAQTAQPAEATGPLPGGVHPSTVPGSRAGATTYLSTRPDPPPRPAPAVAATVGFHATTAPATSTSVLAPVPAPAAELTVDSPASTDDEPTRRRPRDGGDQLPGAVPAVIQAADAGGRRRRFVLPRLEEDRARSDRAIAAVLGEVETSGITRPAVRRQRTRRAAGEAVAHTEVLLVGAEHYAADFMYALARAMEQATRDTDRVQVLPEGNVRLLLEADDVGAGAFIQRARALLGPWLQFAGVTVEFLVRPVEAAVATLPSGGPGAAQP